jgi:perosamine synthetase
MNERASALLSRGGLAVKVAPDEVLRRIRSVLPAAGKRVALHEPRFLGNERAYVTDCIDTAWVSYAGTYVGRFERALADACGTRHAVALANGTVALQVALQVSGVRSRDEVLMPALTFVASANAVVHAGAVPHFVDADEATLGICAEALAAHLSRIGEGRDGALYNSKTGRRISAVLPVHVFGHPVDMDPLTELAARYGLIVIEDATEALGSRYKGRPCGSLAPMAALSFNGNKIVTAGGGGAILTSDDVLATRLRHLTTTAKRPHQWAFLHDEVAWNFRLPNLNAALGLAQLERLAPMLAAKRRLHARYTEAFSDLDGARVFRDVVFAESNYWLVALLLDRGNEELLEPILTATNDAGIATRPAWTPMHRLPMYADSPRANLAVTESVAQRIVNLPSSPFLAP